MIRLIKDEAIEAMDQLIKECIKVDAIITDPPYGTTSCKWDTVVPFDEMWPRLKALRKERAPIVLFGAEPFSSALRMSNIKEYKYDWIWNKPKGVDPFMSKIRPLNDIENISIFSFKKSLYNPQKTAGAPYKKIIDKNPRIKETNNCIMKRTISINTGDRLPKRILKFKQETGIHPTQKPVALMEYLIKTYTNEGDLILDFTCGSGSTGVAANNLNRSFIGIDNGICEKKNSKYFGLPWVDVARDRING